MLFLRKQKNYTFLTFLDKGQLSAILGLATYDWFCADRSQMFILGPRIINRVRGNIL